MNAMLHSRRLITSRTRRWPRENTLHNKVMVKLRCWTRHLVLHRRKDIIMIKHNIWLQTWGKMCAASLIIMNLQEKTAMLSNFQEVSVPWEAIGPSIAACPGLLAQQLVLQLHRRPGIWRKSCRR